MNYPVKIRIASIFLGGFLLTLAAFGQKSGSVDIENAGKKQLLEEYGLRVCLAKQSPLSAPLKNENFIFLLPENSESCSVRIESAKNKIILRHGDFSDEIEDSLRPVDKIRAALLNIWRWNLLSKIQQNDEANAVSLGLKIVPFKITKDGKGRQSLTVDDSRILDADNLTVKTGDIFGFEVTNHSAVPVYLSYMIFDSNGQYVDSDVETASTGLKINPNETWKSDFGLSSEVNVGRYKIKFFAVSEPFDFRNLLKADSNQLIKLATNLMARERVFDHVLWKTATVSYSVEGDAAKSFDAANDEHKRQLSSLYRDVQLNSRQTLAINVSNAPDVSAKKLAAVLQTDYPAGTGVLFYVFSNDRLQIWLITKNGIAANSQTTLTAEQLSAAISNLRYSLNVGNRQAARVPENYRVGIVSLNGKTTKTFEQAASDLTKILMPAPVAKFLKNIKHLIVIPALDIGTTPFSLLRPFDSGEMIIDLMTVSVAPSLFELVKPVKKWNARFRSPLIVGNPSLPAGWINLPGAETEARKVAEVFRTNFLTGKGASEKIVAARAPTSDFLYFATHGLADADNPMSGGFLALSAGEGAGEVGRWTAEEIQRTGIPAQLAILSACQTGLGKPLNAGVTGVARAFQITGVPRVVMSLWNVDDAATADLMQTFVGKLNDQTIPAEALRMAMLEARKKHADDPALWASFVLFGTPR